MLHWSCRFHLFNNHDNLCFLTINVCCFRLLLRRVTFSIFCFSVRDLLFPPHRIPYIYKVFRFLFFVSEKHKQFWIIEIVLPLRLLLPLPRLFFLTSVSVLLRAGWSLFFFAAGPPWMPCIWRTLSNMRQLSLSHLRPESRDFSRKSYLSRSGPRRLLGLFLSIGPFHNTYTRFTLRN